jgi:deferrochelatase/peroxidase EfeB
VIIAAFDVTTTTSAGLIDLLRAWSAAVDPLTAMSTDAALTLTVGFGPSLFDERFGLAARRPPALAQLPAFRRDALLAQRSGGDVVVQACAHDATVIARAIAALEATADTAVQRCWSQTGFRPTPGPVTRNLLGFRDGTANIRTDDRRSLRRHVWVSGPDSMRMGTYLVARRIRMHLQAWERQSTTAQERAIGRHRSHGTRLSPAPRRAHVRLASPALNGGTRILRRSYSYDDGEDHAGVRDRGLMFLSFQRDPAQFVELQHTLDRLDDALGAYLVHTSSAVFACPPAPRHGAFLGEELLFGDRR